MLRLKHIQVLLFSVSEKEGCWTYEETTTMKGSVYPSSALNVIVNAVYKDNNWNNMIFVLEKENTCQVAIMRTSLIHDPRISNISNIVHQ